MAPGVGKRQNPADPRSAVAKKYGMVCLLSREREKRRCSSRSHSGLPNEVSPDDPVAALMLSRIIRASL